MFIMFNFAFVNPDNGLFTILDERASEWESTTLYNWFGVRLDHITTGFGMSALILFSLGIIVAVAKSFGGKTPID